MILKLLLNIQWIFKWYARCLQDINCYNPDEKNKVLIVFDDMIADMVHNKKARFNSNWFVY